MDSLLEQKIIEMYVKKGYQERILHELNHPMKRDRVLHRLCHNYESILKSEGMEPIVSSSSDEITKMILQCGGQKDNCYILSLMDECDGIFLSLNEALDRVVGNGLAAVVYCHNGIAYFEAEQSQGPPPRYILKAMFPPPKH